MSQCVVIDAGAVVESSESPCTGFLLLSPEELTTITSSPFVLSAADGLAVAVAILGCWAVAFSVRALVRALNVGDVTSAEE